MAQSGRAPRPAADAAGDDQPRPDQLQPADQQPLRQPRLRRGAGRDRQSLPHLPAAAGDLLGGDRDGALPDPRPLRQPQGIRQPAGDDGERDAPDPLRPGPGGGGDPRPLRPDHPARLPARRIHARADDPRRHRALLVRLLAADQRRLPAADAHLLQPPAALAGDRPGGDRPGRLRARRRCSSTSPSASAGSSPGPGSGPAPRSSPRRSILRREFGGLELGRLLSTAIRISIASAALAAVSCWSGTCSTARSAAASSARSSRSASGWRSAGSPTWRWRGCCGSPSSSRSCACCAARR